jgi:ATP-binding cassette subfamily B (MDR/TAP) protein 6
LVLKDGQIVEQGSHRELIARAGVFASMWADQISASEEPALAIHESSGKEEVLGYVIDEHDAAPVIEGRNDHLVAPEADLIDTSEATPKILAVEDVPVAIVPREVERPTVDLAELETTPVAFPLTPVVDAPEPLSGVELAFPSSDVTHTVAAPVAFPASNDAPPQNASSDLVTSPPTPHGVTFDATVNTLPRISTPDPESEPKRKRISSQNFQRLARKISITTRRSSSSIPHIPGLMKRDSSPRVSADGGSVRGEGNPTNDSPSSSIKDDADKSKPKKKDKKEKEKKRKSLI